MTKQENPRNGSAKVIKWFVEKILPCIVIGIVGFGIEMFAWRTEVNSRLENLPTIEWKTKVDGQLERKDEQIDELKETVREMRRRMDTAMSTGPAGHMTHREYVMDKE